MSRPRTVSDAEVMEALRRVVARAGPAKLSLAEVGRACGLSAPALVQRFGSRRALLMDYARREAEEAARRFAAARRAEASPLLALSAALSSAVAAPETPEALAHHRALLQGDLADSDFHAIALERARRLREEIARSLAEAVRAGELVPCDHAGLARTVLTTYEGALATWPVFREGRLDDWLADELEAVLAPYLA